MLRLISLVLVILGALGLKRLLPVLRKRRQQVRFIHETLAANRTLDKSACNRVAIHSARPNQQFEAHDSIPSEANTPAG